MTKRGILGFATLAAVLMLLAAPTTGSAGTFWYDQTLGDIDPNTPPDLGDPRICVPTGASTVTYSLTKETNTQPQTAAGQLFGAPNCVGNTIDFNPSGFVAEVPSGPGSEVIDSQINFSIQADTGNVLEKLMIDEAGDLSLVALANSFVQASANITVEINAIDDPNGLVAQITVIKTPSLNFPADPNVIDPNFIFAPWAISEMFDLDQILIDEGYLAGTHATQIDVTINNNLAAFSQAGSDSTRIAKKDAEGLTVTVIPEPGTHILIGLGLASVAFIRRRRSS